MTSEPADVPRVPVVIEAAVSPSLLLDRTSTDDTSRAYGGGLTLGSRLAAEFQLSSAWQFGVQAGYQYIRYGGAGFGVAPRAHLGALSVYVQYSFGSERFRSGPRLGLGVFAVFDATSPSPTRSPSFIRRGDYGGVSVDLGYYFAVPISQRLAITSSLGLWFGDAGSGTRDQGGVPRQAYVALGARYAF